MVKWTVPPKMVVCKRQATKDLLLAATSGEQSLDFQREAFQKKQQEKEEVAKEELQKLREATLASLQTEHQQRVKVLEQQLAEIHAALQKQRDEHEDKKRAAEADHQHKQDAGLANLRQRHELDLQHFEEQLHRVRASLRKESEESGISAAYVHDRFPQEVHEVLPPSEDQDPNFRTIRKYLMERPDGKPGKGEETVCPRDGQMGSSFMDAEVRAHRAKATHFVSWCWGYSMRQFGSAIRGHFGPKGQDLSSIFLWVCFFCNNQYRIFRDKTMTGTQELSAAFESHLVGAGQMLVMLDDFMHPKYISRVWCIFEMYVSIDQDIPHEIILPESAQANFAKTRITPMELREHFATLDVQNAEASDKKDEKAIKDTIKKHIGFDKVNTKVRDNLSKWVVDAFSKAILG